MAPGWPQSGPMQDQRRVGRGYNPQVTTGALPGTRTPNPQIKSPLLGSIFLPELLPSDAGTCRYLPFCAVARIRGGLRIPRAAGAYRDIRANMEQTWVCTGLDPMAGESLRSWRGVAITSCFRVTRRGCRSSGVVDELIMGTRPGRKRKIGPRRLVTAEPGALAATAGPCYGAVPRATSRRRSHGVGRGVRRPVVSAGQQCLDQDAVRAVDDGRWSQLHASPARGICLAAGVGPARRPPPGVLLRDGARWRPVRG